MKVYIVLLEKIESLRGKCFEKYEKPTKNQDTWITLGHFDAMHTYELPLNDKNLFQAIHESNKRIFAFQRDGRYFYPLYLISSENASPVWEGAQPFLAISKIHFAETVGTNRAYSSLLESLKGHMKKYSCTYCAFRTIELSDMILTVTANRLSDLLNFIMTLRVYPSVGKVYTYVGINYDAAKNPLWIPNPEDKIDLLSMRFSVTDFSLAPDVLTYIKGVLGKEPTYSVSGVDDIAVNWTELETCKLVDLYRRCFLTPEKEDLPWGKCFADVTSRVGIPLEKVKVDGVPNEGNSFQSESSARLQTNCEKLLQLCSEIRDSARNRGLDYNWIDPLSTLTNTLVRISRTAVLDEFVYIMFAGVDAFLKNVKKSLQDSDGRSISQYQDFVENWAHLMEHIMRIEGQLTHNPEMRPILYDIPVAMLEYTLSFLKKISEILQAKDSSEKKTDICFLLVPRLCDRIEAEELFPATPNVLPGLVLVTIPLQSLYDAPTVQRELCHEVSHFVGETCRNRTDRKKKYVQATAALMARICFGTVHPALLEAIQDRLMQQDMGNPGRPRIAEMQKAVLQWVDCLSKEQEEYYALIWNALQKSNASEPLKLDLANTLIDGTKVSMFCSLQDDLSILFREIYADICMLYLLQIEEQEYVESLIQELASEKLVKSRRYEQFAIRIYIGLTATACTIPWEYIQCDDTLYREMKKIHMHLNNDEEDLTDRMIPMTSIYFLLRYAERCHESLCSLPQEKLGEIRKMFSGSASSQMNYEQFLEYINQYRIKLLEN